MSPFLLPDGPVAIQNSGGRTSGMLSKLILDANRDRWREDWVFLFQNTGREMPETLDFVQAQANHFGVRTVWLEYTTDNDQFFQVVGHNSANRDGRPFEQLIEKRQMLPNAVMRFCTEEMKIRTAKRYLLSLGWERWHTVVGFRADEPDRVLRINDPENKRERETVLTPLAAAGITRRMVSDWWKEQPFNLRLPDNNGKTPLGNCDGCFLKSEKVLAGIARDYPGRAQWWAKMEERWKTLAGTAATFHKDTSWKELIEYVIKSPSFIFDLPDEESPLCVSSYGSCTEY